MKEKQKIKGKLHVGYSYPTHNGEKSGWQLFKEMSFNSDRLDFSGGAFNNKYSFLKEDIISIEPYTTFLPYRKGVRIIHKVKNYYPWFIFTSSKENSDNLIRKIKESGFFDGDNSKIDIETVNEVRTIQKGSLKLTPFLKIYIIIIVLFIVSYFVFNWNFLDKLL